jgi:serine/threonine protein kinase
MSEERLESLLSAWREQQRQGRDVPAAQLCHEYPELAPELERRIRALRQRNDLAAQQAESRPPAEAVTLPPDPAAAASTVPRGSAGPDEVRVPGYEVLATLGRGGMGVVYQARQTKLGRLVALKMILSGVHAGEADLARFRTEAEAIARLQHPNIVQIYEVGEHGGLPFFSLEYCGGGSLESRLKDPWPPRQAAELVRTLARAVQAAHQAGIIHRDLKPANILLVSGGVVSGEWSKTAAADHSPLTPKITDFGLAKKIEGGEGLTQTGAVLGTPSYMAPEQAGGDNRRVTTLVDVYALGAILYECLTGRPPFRAATAIDTILQVLERPPEPPSALRPGIDRGLERICLKCLAKEPARRYASADHLAADLENWLAGVPISVQPPTVREALRLWLRQSFGAAGWTIPVGLLSGFLMSAIVWLLVIHPAISKLAGSYRTLTGHSSPWLALPGRAIPTWLANVAGLAALLVLGAQGLLTARLVRPLNRQADLAAGLITGLIAAVAFFTLSFGWLAVMARTFMGTDVETDLGALSQAAWVEGDPAAKAPPLPDRAGPGPRERLLGKYPRLRELSARGRARAVQEKIDFELVTSIPLGIWFGMVAALGLCVPVSVSGAVAAGASLRRDGRLWRALPAYLELVLPVAVACAHVFVLLLVPLIGLRLKVPVWYFALVLVMTALAITGVRRRWHWMVRLPVHACWMFLLVFEPFFEVHR